MKPKTKLQKQVAELTPLLPELTDKQELYALQFCFAHHGYRFKKHTFDTICMDCHHKFITQKNKVKCPSCGTTLKIIDTQKRIDSQERHYCILDSYCNFQIIRFFFVTKYSKINGSKKYEFTEVAQHWIDSKGNVVTKTILKVPFWDTWSLGSDLAIRNRSYKKDIYLNSCCVYKVKKVIPILKRNGFKGNFHDIPPLALFEDLIKSNDAEILFKSGQIELYKYFTQNNFNCFDKYRKQIKICIRHGYIVSDPYIWVDLINDLEYLGKDISNPDYICPADLHRDHTRYTERRRDIERAKSIEEQKARIEQDNKLYQKQKKRFFGLKITDGTIDIVTLDSVNEFLIEGDTHCHCVFTNEYYKETNSLILSARTGDKRLETIEVDLKKYKVVQSRGLYNQNSEYHNQIVNLVNTNMSLIKKLRQRKVTCS